MDFSTTAINVAILLAMALPGFILVKGKLIKEHAIQYFSVLLLYVNQSFLSLYSFLKIEYTKQLAVNIGIVFLITLGIQLVTFCVLWLCLRRWFDKPAKTAELLKGGYVGENPLIIGDTITGIGEDIKLELAMTNRGRALRILVLNASMGNVGFFGIPLLQLMFPEHPEYIAYSAVYIVSLNLIAWTLGAYVVSGDRKFVSIRKAIINPQVITLCVALPLFFCGVTINSLPVQISKIITYLADMTVPMCMIIIGMRLGAAKFKQTFTDVKAYLSMICKNLLLPLFVYLVLLPFDMMDGGARMAIVLLSAMPTAAIGHNFAEIYNGDKRTSINSILISTIFSVVTIPLIMLLITKTM